MADKRKVLAHSAEQIDNAVSRSLPGGYYDKWVSQLVNPNLLDNWYFGNPVDQRQGRVVVPNTTYYSDNKLATAAGTTSAYVTAYRYATGTVSGVNYASFKLTDSDTAPTYYAAPEDVVRGYTGAGYGIDRWIQDGSITTLLTNDGLQITNSSDVAFGISQIFETNYSGKTLTASILTEPGTRVVVWYNLNQIAVIQADSGGLATISFVAPTNDISKLSLAVGKGTFLFKAAKLELGTVQTLAHQDANGNWVLNDIPDYGDQLRRCQRYAVQLNGRYWMPLNADSVLRLNIPLPVTMRAKPSVTFTQGGTNAKTVTFDSNLTDKNQLQFFVVSDGGSASVSNIFATADL